MCCCLLALKSYKGSCLSLKFFMLYSISAHAMSSHLKYSFHSSEACDPLCPLEIPDWFLAHWNQRPKPCRLQWGKYIFLVPLLLLSRNHLALDTKCLIVLNKLPKERKKEHFFSHSSSSGNLELYTDLLVFSVCVLSVCLLWESPITYALQSYYKTAISQNDWFHSVFAAY